MNKKQNTIKALRRISRRYLKKRVKNFDNLDIYVCDAGHIRGLIVQIQPKESFSKKQKNNLLNVLEGLANRLYTAPIASGYAGLVNIHVFQDDEYSADSQIQQIEI